MTLVAAYPSNDGRRLLSATVRAAIKTAVVVNIHPAR
jgi:hypothetical protein